MVAVPVETSLRAVMIVTAKKPKWQGLLRAKQQQWQIRLRIIGDVSLYQNLYTAVFPPSALPEECPL